MPFLNRRTKSGLLRDGALWFEAQQLLTGSLRLVTVMLGMELCRFGGVMRRVMQVTMGGMRMMSRRLVIAGFMMLSCFAMVAGRVFMMLSRLMMMLCRLCGHVPLLCIGDQCGRTEATGCLLMQCYSRVNTNRLGGEVQKMACN